MENVCGRYLHSEYTGYHYLSGWRVHLGYMREKKKRLWQMTFNKWHANIKWLNSYLWTYHEQKDLLVFIIELGKSWWQCDPNHGMWLLEKKVGLLSGPETHYFTTICTLPCLASCWRETHTVGWCFLVFPAFHTKKMKTKKLIRRYIVLSLKKYLAKCSNTRGTWWQSFYLNAYHTEKIETFETVLCYI